jgi:hypothetical protein
MPTVCMQCSLRHIAEKGLADPPPVFEESPEAHAARVHPGGVTAAERRDVLRRANEVIFAELKRKGVMVDG